MTFAKACLVSLGFLSATVCAQTSKTPEVLPASDRINKELPSWMRFGGEERIRMEYINGSGFRSINDSYLLDRLRLNLRIRPLPWLSLNFQAEDARVFGQNTLPAPASQKDSLDLRLGYAQVGLDDGRMTVRVGRQGLDFGDGRLLADPNWSNVGRSFDAARLTLRRGAVKVDLFSGIAVRVNQLDFDQSTPGGHFHGAYGSMGGLIPHATVEPYFFWRLEHNYKCESGTTGNLDERTFGVRVSGTLPLNLDYASETASQKGSYANDGVSAWTGRWVLGETLPDTRHRPRLFFEYARASGDGDPKDGRHGTFDPLFPSSHDKYGLTDLFGSTNIVYLRPGAQYTVRPGMTLSLAYGDFRLARSRDALYVAGKEFARSADGTAGSHVGREIDLNGLFALSKSTQLNIGYGRLFPGEFLKRTTSGVPFNIVFCNLTQRF